MAEESLGLRERKKRQTAHRIWRTALDLFVERGFDKVSVAEIAAAADVSKMTVFNYFGTKEDVLLAPLEAHVADAADAVRDREPGESAVAALRRQFLAKVDGRDPSIGLSDDVGVVQLLRLISDTPALARRVMLFQMRGIALLTDVLAEETGDRLTAGIAAHQLVSARDAVVVENHRRLLAGDRADAMAADCAALAERAFDLVEKGLQGYPASA
ncbi:TetR family transcriptional regulator [Streptomyces alfalfae]|uniref:TetR family transcriptional regulator n=1 Tax=Streptomyces alfalfae TaxID=1642299 RepID=A0A1P8TIN0_9ACTN|nr:MULTISPECIES: TetR/AcrR family transcriptional regulator [Streptomyces]AYA17903.1 TetR family transcriptional regulator [Streptomyces fradiae]APY87492.1 TetR family transcriptional regulator [Streptomyces alfalfae]KUL50512.1 TetR family transcriptional regulator [Streptomyces sp. NRRL S-1521]QQC90184.1 TetR/AcrR family transcriptional regulator [Streptomyces alfalfae]QUI32662.1 TetR/AcrR family transcriptional regulator [Streptomyces alfalfae]